MLNPFDLLLDLSPTRFQSGEALARAHGVSRMAVWKAMRRLMALGIGIESVRGRGYRLAAEIELLEVARIHAALGDDLMAVLDGIEVLPTIRSTNAYLMSAIRPEDPGRVAVFAEHQEAGRGRRGRVWHSPFGANLYLSLRWQFQLPAASLGLLSLAVATELAQILEGEGVEGHGLKWPNDLLWNGRKMGGLLLELAGEQQGPCAVVIGLGLNWRMPPEAGNGIDQPWVDLQHVLRDAACTRNRLAGRALAALVSSCLKFEAHGFEAFREQWTRYDLLQGQQVNVHLADTVYTGRALGIDDSGRLEVERDGQVTPFTSGEVSVRPAR